MAKSSVKRKDGSSESGGRAGIIALAIILVVLALVCSLVSLAFCYSDAITAQFVDDLEMTDDDDLPALYRRRATTLSPRRMSKAVLQDALGRIDRDVFFAAEPWVSVRRSMTLRLVAYGVLLLGALLTIASNARGPRIMLGACLILVIHGVIESVAIFSHGQALASEFSRDLAIRVAEVVEGAKLQSNFGGRTIAFRPLDPNAWKFAVGIYFVVVTVFWQIAALSLALVKPPANQESIGKKALE